MQVTRISANVRYSKQMPDGAFKTVELGAEGSLDSSDETWQEAQAALYHQLGDQLRYVFNGNGAGKPQNGSQGHVQPLPEPPLPPAPLNEHWCQEHQTAFQKHEKDGRT
jgi:hypothetical protein